LLRRDADEVDAAAVDQLLADAGSLGQQAVEELPAGHAGGAPPTAEILDLSKTIRAAAGANAAVIRPAIPQIWEQGRSICCVGRHQVTNKAAQ
jgi:hypothetical protein